MKPLFALARILGNELPPRDLPGGRYAALTALLREPPLSGVIKFWILNRVWDPRLRAAYRERLADQGDIYEIPFEPEQYFAAAHRGERLRYCPGINSARNTGLRLAFEQYNARFAAVFDGDCGCTQGQWEEILAEILGDAIDGRVMPAYSVPIIRIGYVAWDEALTGRPQRHDPRGEPQLIVARRGWEEHGICYDETLAFGDGDKVELLVRLGHHGGLDRQNEIATPGMARNIGTCCHINTGASSVEDGGIRGRWPARAASLAQLHDDIVQYYQGASL
jgi:hypothetical protein